MEGFALLGIAVFAGLIVFGTTYLASRVANDYDYTMAWVASSLIATAAITLYAATLMGIITPGG